LDLKSVIDTRRKGEPDIILFITVFVLVGIGIAMSYSASAVFSLKTFGDSFYFLKRQIIWFVVGFIALLLFQEVDYRIYKRYTKIMLIASFFLLVLVLIPGIGHSVKGSVRWLGIGQLKFQPSEFIKVGIVIYLAKVFSSEKGGTVNHVLQLLIPMLIIATIFVLIMLQPDFSTAVDLLLVSVLILFVSGFPLFYIVTLFLVSIPMFYLLIYQVDYRRERFLAYLNPWSDRFGIGYHIIQSFIAFKKGGLFGVGLGHGTQKLKRLPEPHTDFIFAVIAEESGLLGTIIIVGLYCAVFWRGFVISLGAPDEFGRLLAIGLTLLIVVQAFINIAVVSGNLPTTGMPLPFLSYGGSSLISNMIAVGILLNISRYREAAHEGVKLSEEVWE
jgi:cell division protein FtsW